MTTVEILRAAKARIDTPGKWYSGDVRWEWTPDCGDDPTCALLAISREVGGYFFHPAKAALSRAMGGGGLYSIDIPAFNDSHTHAEVMAAFERAIANEEARAQEFEVAPVVEVMA